MLLYTKARLYSVSTPESGAWLNALPLSAIGLCMDDATVCIAVCLRLGLPLCCPHSCRHCGSFVDVHATMACIVNRVRAGSLRFIYE